MSIIGVFAPTKEGGWSGSIRTLTTKIEARFVPNDNRASDSAPTFRIYAGRSEIGAAWRRETGSSPPKGYYVVRLDDPCLSEPITAALFETADGKEAQLVWKRKPDA